MTIKHAFFLSAPEPALSKMARSSGVKVTSNTLVSDAQSLRKGSREGFTLQRELALRPNLLDKFPEAAKARLQDPASQVAPEAGSASQDANNNKGGH